jgi:hypothetical protein
VIRNDGAERRSLLLSPSKDASGMSSTCMSQSTAPTPGIPRKTDKMSFFPSL